MATNNSGIQAICFFFLVKSEGKEKEEKGREQEFKILTTVTRNLAIARFLCKYSRPF